MMKYFLFALFLAVTLNCFSQKEIYVYVAAEHPGTGTFDRPFNDINAAINAANCDTSKHVILYIRQGIYYLSSPIRISEASWKHRTLTVSAWQNDTVEICGSRRLKPDWHKSKGKLWQAKVPCNNFDQLFINGTQKILARYPNFSKDAILNGTAADALSPQRIKRWKNPQGGFIHSMHSGLWGDMHYVIEGKKNGQLIYKGGFQNNRPSPIHPQYRFVENIREELDSPGEWFLDKKNSILYYYPQPGEQLQNSLVEVAVLPQLITITGTPSHPIRNITINRLRFKHTLRTFMSPYEALMRSDWCIYRGAALYIENSQNCTVSNCEFSHLGGNAIFISRYNLGTHIKTNYIHSIGANAICVVGDTSAVRSGTFGYNNFTPYDRMDKIPGPKNSQYPRQCLIEDNLIHHIGLVEKQVAGVEIQLASEITVSHNTIYRVPRAAINIGDGAFGGDIIEYNDAFQTVLETSDHGAFNSWGRDRFWLPDYNQMTKLVAQHPELILLDAIHTNIIRNNRFRCDHGWDIDLDDGSSNYQIYNNVCLNGGIKLREGFYRTVENNILINNSLHPHVWFPNSGDVIRRNIFMQAYKPISVNGWGKSVDYNFFATRDALLKAQKNQTDPHSLCGSLPFKNHRTGDYTLSDTCKAFQIGFENIPQHFFGVYSLRLKQLAAKPSIPFLQSQTNQRYQKNGFFCMGAKLRPVQDIDDCSAYGLPNGTHGLIVLALQDSTFLSPFPVKQNDVILEINGKAVPDIQTLQSFDFTKCKTITVFRNQTKCRLKPQ